MNAAKRLDDIHLSKNPKSFLISLAVGIWKNQKRKDANRQKIVPMVDIEEESADNLAKSASYYPEEILLKKEACQLVRLEVKLLEDKYRLPVYMFYVAELPVEQIAYALRIPKGIVKSRLHKARILIKKACK